MFFKYFFISLISSFLITNVYTQNNEGKIRILFIFDGSNSMNAQWAESSKIASRPVLMISLNLLFSSNLSNSKAAV